jgi:hypothetical protein
MRTLPTTMIQVLAPFAPPFSKRVWQHVQVLLAGAILAPGNRTVASALRAVGLEKERRFCRYHRVLSRAKWSTQKASRILLGSLVEAFVSEGDPLVVGIDETLKRRQGKRIVVRGIYRDPVVPATAISRRLALLDGCALRFWQRSPGLVGCGPCRSSRRWLLPSATQESTASGTRR